MITYDLIFPYDHIILVVIILNIIFCFWKGFIQSILGLLTWIGSILITIYTYNSVANFVLKQILKINFFQNNEYLINIFSIIISIPIIFLFSLFILKRIRKFLSSDLDKQIIGIIIDKIFGILYGIIFSYIILSAVIVILNKFEFNSINFWFISNSNIIMNIDYINNNYDSILNNIEKEDQ